MKSRVRICNCPDCGKQYTNKFNLKRRYSLAHLHEAKFVCEFCGKSLSSKQNYREHTYIHTGDKPFVCRECGVRYRQCSQLSVHHRIHRAIHHLQQDEFHELKVRSSQLTDILNAEKLKEFGDKEQPTPKLFEAVQLPPLGQPNPKVRLEMYIFAD